MTASNTAGVAVDQVVDPEVSVVKFQRELAAYRDRQKDYLQRGWWLLDAEFPTILVAFAAPQLMPPPVVFGVLLDFTNYDVEPPSVRVVNPFTQEPYRHSQLPTHLLRRQTVNIQLGPNGPVAQQSSGIPLLQAHGPDDIPFLCVPGVREYHTHPAHTGDSWHLHRGSGEGTLFSILNTFYQYGVQPLRDFTIGMKVIGYQQAEPPL